MLENNSNNENLDRALYEAIESKQFDKAVEYLNQGANPNYSPEPNQKHPAIMCAAKSGQYDLVDLMLAKGHIDEFSFAEMMKMAIRRDEPILFSSCLKSSSYTNMIANEYELLVVAVYHKLFYLEQLIAAGANVNHIGNDMDKSRKAGPLIWATDMLKLDNKGVYNTSCNIPAMKALLNAGADVNHRERWDGFTALAYTIRNNNIEAFNLLLSHMAVQEDKASFFAEYLEEAIRCKCWEFVDELTKQGADILRKPKNESTYYSKIIKTYSTAFGLDNDTEKTKCFDSILNACLALMDRGVKPTLEDFKQIQQLARYLQFNDSLSTEVKKTLNEKIEKIKNAIQLPNNLALTIENRLTSFYFYGDQRIANFTSILDACLELIHWGVKPTLEDFQQIRQLEEYLKSHNSLRNASQITFHAKIIEIQSAIKLPALTKNPATSYQAAQVDKANDNQVESSQNRSFLKMSQ